VPCIALCAPKAMTSPPSSGVDGGVVMSGACGGFVATGWVTPRGSATGHAREPVNWASVAISVTPRLTVLSRPARPRPATSRRGAREIVEMDQPSSATKVTHIRDIGRGSRIMKVPGCSRARPTQRTSIRSATASPSRPFSLCRSWPTSARGETGTYRSAASSPSALSFSKPAAPNCGIGLWTSYASATSASPGRPARSPCSPTSEPRTRPKSPSYPHRERAVNTDRPRPVDAG
jgi:hypothetical protein